MPVLQAGQVISLRGREINADGKIIKHPHNEIVREFAPTPTHTLSALGLLAL
jgi:hypothetical protein